MLGVIPIVAYLGYSAAVLAVGAVIAACKDDEAPPTGNTGTDSGTKTSTKTDAGNIDAGRIDAGPHQCLPPVDRARDSDGDGIADYCDCGYEAGRPQWDPARINSSVGVGSPGRPPDNPLQDLDVFEEQGRPIITGIFSTGNVNHLFRARPMGPHVDDLGSIGGPFRNEGLLQVHQLIPSGDRAYVPWITGDGSTSGIDVIVGGQSTTRSLPQAGIEHQAETGGATITNQIGISGAGVVVDGARLLLGGEVLRAVDARLRVIPNSGGAGSVVFYDLAPDGNLLPRSTHDRVKYTSGRVRAMGELDERTVVALSRGDGRVAEATLDLIAVDTPGTTPRSTIRLGPRSVQDFPELAVGTSTTGSGAVAYIASTTSSAGVQLPALLRADLNSNTLQDIPLPRRLAGGAIADTTIFHSERFGPIPAMTIRRPPSSDPFELRGWVVVAFPVGNDGTNIVWDFCITEPGLEPKSIVATRHAPGSLYDDGLLIGVSNLLMCEEKYPSDKETIVFDHRGVELLNVDNWLADCK